MPDYNIEVLGWSDFSRDENRYLFDEPLTDVESDIDAVGGMFVRVTTTDDPDEVQMFWVYTQYPLEDWGEWLALITQMADEYMQELS